MCFVLWGNIEPANTLSLRTVIQTDRPSDTPILRLSLGQRLGRVKILEQGRVDTGDRKRDRYNFFEKINIFSKIINAIDVIWFYINTK